MMAMGERDATAELPAEVIPQIPGMPVHRVPTRYLTAAGGDKEKARERWAKTHQWRSEAKMDEALYEEWWQMDQLKKDYRHCFHRRAKNGSVIYYDRLDFRYMSAVVDGVAGPRLSPDELIRYYMMTTDFVYADLATEDPGGTLTTVYDLSRFTLSSLLGSSVPAIKKIIRLYSVHYPERQAKVFLINAPSFFSGLWSSIRPFLDPAVVSSISISTRNRAELLQYVGSENVPLEYGGTDTTPLGEAPEEKKWRAWIAQNRERSAGAGGANHPVRGEISTGATCQEEDKESIVASGTDERCQSGTVALAPLVLRARITSATVVALMAVWIYAYLQFS